MKKKFEEPEVELIVFTNYEGIADSDIESVIPDLPYDPVLE